MFAAPFRDDIQKDVKALSETVLGGDAPLLVGFLANDDIAAKSTHRGLNVLVKRMGLNLSSASAQCMNSRES